MCNKHFENISKFKYLRQHFARTNEFMMKLREYSGNEYYYSIHEVLSPHLLSKTLNTGIH
jgi:hypothetical protein